MDDTYEPEVNDYVIWDQGEYGIDEGWVYFKAPEFEPVSYTHLTLPTIYSV